MTGPRPPLSWRQRLEAAAPEFNLRGEIILAVCMLPLGFLYKILDCLYGKNALTGQPWPYILLLATFTAPAFASLFALATEPGEAWLRKKLATGRAWQVALIPAAYFCLYILVLWLGGLPQLSTQALAQLPTELDFIPWPLVVLGAAALMFAGLLAGMRLAGGQPAERFTLRHLGSAWLAALPFLLLQEILPLVWCFTTPVAAVVLIFASGLGRRHFCFSFVPRCLAEAGQVLALLAGGIALFLVSSLGMGTISYTGGLWSSPWFTVADSSFVWIFIVGVSEEIIFRCGLLTLVADEFGRRNPGSWPARQPKLTAVVMISALFGLAHIFRGATLFFLATLASLLYGLAFIAGKTLFGPVMLHGILNILILMNFHLSDFH